VSITAISPPFTGRTITGTVIGTIFVLDGESVLLDGARVVGHVIVQPGGTLYTEDAVIAGRVIADRPAAVRLCGSDVAGSRYNPAVVINGSSGSVILGDPASGCAGNRFRSDVILTANQSVVFGGNTATYVTVSNNGPGGTVLKGNTVTRLSCSGNTPAPTNAGQPNRGSRRSQCASL
jgi:hexosaminidase